jgi:SAM-dependent methyltransferase
MRPGSSNPAPFDEATIRFYAREAPDYVASGRGGTARHLDSFLDRLEPGAHILELGCGGGRDAEAMLARGFEVDATDGVAEMACKAEARLDRPVRVMRFDELDAVEAYGAVWAHASLLHVPFASLPEVLTRIFRSLAPGGWHFASYKAGGGEGRDRFGRYFNYPSADALVEAYRRSAAWSELANESYRGGGYDGGQGPWIAVMARK